MNKETIQRKPDFATVVSPITTLEDLLAHPVQEPKNIKIGEKPTNIGKSPVLVLSEERPNMVYLDGSAYSEEQVFTIVINDPLFGKRQNQIYWETAPSDSFGLDLNDIKNDHTRLLTQNAAYERQLRMHQSLGRPWKVFTRFGPGELQAIAYRKTETAPLIPIIRWVKRGDSKRDFIYSPFMHTENGKSAVKVFLGKNIPESAYWENVLDPALGVCTLAMVSPEQRKKWPKSHGIRGEGSMTMGSTQALLLSMVMEGDLTYSPLLKAAETHVRSNGEFQTPYLFQ